jgi:predicted transcriptional regulator
VDAQREIDLIIEDSPSLRRHLEQSLQKIYQRAVKDALLETKLTARAKEFNLPEKCPYHLADLLEGDLDALRDVLA